MIRNAAVIPPTWTVVAFRISHVRANELNVTSARLVHLIGTYQNRRAFQVSWMQTSFELHNGSPEEFAHLSLY